MTGMDGVAPTLWPQELAELTGELPALGLWPGHGDAILDALGSGQPLGFIARPAGSGWARAVKIVAGQWSPVLDLPVLRVAATTYTAHELQTILGNRCVVAAALRHEPAFEARCLVVWHQSSLVSDDEVDAVQKRVREAGGKLLLISAAAG